jgi:hypothetical protein
MRTAFVLLSVIGAVFAVGLACGLLLSGQSREPRPTRFPRMPRIGIDVRLLARRPRPDADRGDPAGSAAGDADRDWDTYDSGAADTEPA